MIKIIITCLLCKGRKGFSWFQLLLILQDNYFYFLKKVFLDVLSFFFFFNFLFTYLAAGSQLRYVGSRSLARMNHRGILFPCKQSAES